MITSIQITIKPQEEQNQSLINKLIKQELNKNFKEEIKASNNNVKTIFQKKSIDARHGQIKIHLKYQVLIGESENSSNTELPQWKNVSSKKTVIIVGSGPAGLFGALKLLESGIKPIIIERGKQTNQRRQDIALISTKNIINENSNYCFGEGGAGTFSDGKLYTRSNKRGNINTILKIFNYFGADKKILTDAHAHIGTDRLPKVINNMRDKIIELGGEFYFNTLCTNLIIENEITKGIKIKNLETNEEKELYADAVVLATGHSSLEIYSMLSKINPDSLEAKTFAMGVRVEHPRTVIDSIQFHGNVQKELGAAEYRVTTQIKERGVYSFCMCPGGFVVPSASGPNQIVVNGMSTAARNSKWSNAAIVVEIRPEDIPQEFEQKAKKANCPNLKGLYFRNYIEELAKQNGKDQKAPAQLLIDFLENKKTEDFPPVSYTPGIISSNLNDWLPSFICERLALGFKEINKNMKGFICPQAVLIAPETRTSTPVRILRNKETFENPYIKRLYAVGEGSGYSGGIVSSAMDGENACAVISKTI